MLQSENGQCIVCEVGNFPMDEKEYSPKVTLEGRFSEVTKVPIISILENSVVCHTLTPKTMICLACIAAINLKESREPYTHAKGAKRKFRQSGVSSTRGRRKKKKVVSKLEDNHHSEGEKSDCEVTASNIPEEKVVLHIPFADQTVVSPFKAVPKDTDNDVPLNAVITIKSEIPEANSEDLAQEQEECQITLGDVPAIKSEPEEIVVESISCPRCCEQFETYKLLNDHFSSNHTDTIQCMNCQLVVDKYIVLDSHLVSEHGEECSIKCKLCSKQFVLAASLEEHVRNSHSFKCLFCSRVFKDMTELKRHKQATHKNEKLKCLYCSYQTKSEAAFMRHDAKVHQKSVKLVHPCSQCNLEFNTIPEREEHCVFVHNLEKLHKCKLCGQCFALESMEKYHTKVHHSSFHCSKCSMPFKREEKLKAHIKNVHKLDCLDLNEDEILSGVMEYSTNETISSNLEQSNSSVQSETSSESLIPDHIMSAKIEEFIRSCRGKSNSDKVECFSCKAFITVGHLRPHLNKHFGRPQYACLHCDFKAYQSTNLRKHIRTRHPHIEIEGGKTESIACTFCSKMFGSYNTLEVHLWQHMSDKSFECSVCKAKFGMEASFKDHMKKHYFKRRKQCPTCPREFTSIGFYNEHVKKCRDKWTCSECGKQCSNENSYRKHLRNSHPTSDQLKFVCPYDNCCKEFTEKHCWEDHMITHDKEKRARCPLCGKKFKRIRNMRDHIQSCHEDEVFHCLSCSFSTTAYDMLIQHKKECHPSRFPCDVCGLYFVNELTLQNHEQISHPDDESVEFIGCSICSEVFATELAFKLHKYLVHSIKVCTVNDCFFEFTDEDDACLHMKIHKEEYACASCGLQFYSEITLTDHISITHSSLVSCSDCGQTFYKKQLLDLHKKEHSSDQLYSCMYCQKLASSKAMLLSHMMSDPSCAGNRMKIKISICSYCDESLIPKEVGAHISEHIQNGIEASIKDSFWKEIDIHSDAMTKCSGCRKLLENKPAFSVHLSESPGCAFSHPAKEENNDQLQYVLMSEEDKDSLVMEVDNLQENYVFELMPENGILICGMDDNVIGDGAVALASSDNNPVEVVIGGDEANLSALLTTADQDLLLQ